MECAGLATRHSRLAAAMILVSMAGMPMMMSSYNPVGKPGNPPQEADPGTPLEEAPHEGELLIQKERIADDQFRR